MTPLPGPLRVAHIDWSVSPRKRWLTTAEIGKDGRVRVEAPRRFDGPALRALGIEDLADSPLEKSRGHEADKGRVSEPPLLLGFDFSIGLPRDYAEKIGVDSFRDFLRKWSSGRWPRWDQIAEAADQISLERPFYPRSSRGVRQLELLAAHGVSDLDTLRRECERARPGRRAACPLFWTLGAQQVGRGSLAGWREILLPLLRPSLADARDASHPIPASIWPFDGPLRDLLENSQLTISEAYPTEFHRSLGLDLRGGKRSAATRRAQAPSLLDWARRNDVLLSPSLEAAIETGFPVPTGGEAAGEDPFDSVVGLFGMLDVVAGRLSGAAPFTQSWLAVEGWILGCPID